MDFNQVKKGVRAFELIPNQAKEIDTLNKRIVNLKQTNDNSKWLINQRNVQLADTTIKLHQTQEKLTKTENKKTTIKTILQWSIVCNAVLAVILAIR